MAPIRIIQLGSAATWPDALRDIVASSESLVIDQASLDQLFGLVQSFRPDLILASSCGDGSRLTQLVEGVRRAESRWWTHIWSVNGKSDDLVNGVDGLIPQGAAAEWISGRFGMLAKFVSLQRQTRADLEHIHNRLNDHLLEMRTAASVMRKLIEMPAGTVLSSHVWNAPASNFSGDLLYGIECQDGALEVILGDGVGHGLTAALNVLPIIPAFERRVRRQLPLGQAVVDIYSAIRSHLPAYRFVAATIVRIDPSKRRVQVWNGGNPDALLFDERGHLAHRFTSRHLPLGVAPDLPLDTSIESVHFQDGHHLLLCSDGILEATSARGELFGEARLLGAIAGCEPHNWITAIKDAVVNHLQGESAHDDLTAVVLDVDQVTARVQARMAIDFDAHAD